MEAIIGQQAKIYIHSQNDIRISCSKRLSNEFAKQAKVNHREETIVQRDMFEQEEGPVYGSGLID